MPSVFCLSFLLPWPPVFGFHVVSSLWSHPRDLCILARSPVLSQRLSLMVYRDKLLDPCWWPTHSVHAMPVRHVPLDLDTKTATEKKWNVYRCYFAERIPFNYLETFSTIMVKFVVEVDGFMSSLSVEMLRLDYGVSLWAKCLLRWNKSFLLICPASEDTGSNMISVVFFRHNPFFLPCLMIPCD